MNAIFRHELSSYFNGISGYVFGAFMLLFAGIYTMVICLNSQVANFEYVVSNMDFIFLILVPIVTMRVIAEERRQKTDQLLYALPMGMTQVVLGKFFALLVVMLIPTGIMCLYPLYLHSFGDVYLPAAYGAIIGFYFLGAALMSIGVFVSSLTESQPVAAGLSFAVLLVNYFISNLSGYLSTTATSSMLMLTVGIIVLFAVIVKLTKNIYVGGIAAVVLELILMAVYLFKDTLLESLVPNLLQKLSLFAVFSTFTNGVFDLTGIVYFLSVIGIFLFLTVQSMEKRRWSE